MKKIFKTAFAIVSSLLITKVNAMPNTIHNRVNRIRKTLNEESKKELTDNKIKDIVAYLESDKKENNDNFQWRNNPNWSKNWSNYWNQQSWRNWNKKSTTIGW